MSSELLQGRCPRCDRAITRANLFDRVMVRCPNRRCEHEFIFDAALLHARKLLDSKAAKKRELQAEAEERRRNERDREQARQTQREEQRRIIRCKHRGHDLPHRAAHEYLPFQKDGIVRMLKSTSMLLADDMGLGKTIQAIGLINSLDIENVLIICPASLKLNWQDELHNWLTRLAGRTITVVNADRPNCRGSILIVNYDILDRLANVLAKRKWDLIIGDEAHRIKNPRADRSKAFRRLSSDRRLLLTGTPMLNRPHELWTLLNWLAPDQWPNLTQFENRYCGAISSHRSRSVSGATNIEELHERIKPLMLRRSKTEVLKELPPKFRQIIRLPCDDERILAVERKLCSELIQERERLKRVIREARLLANDEELHKALRELRQWERSRRGHISRIRHQTALAKVPSVIKHLNDIISESRKAICFAWHRDVIDKIFRAFARRSVRFYGGMSSDEKQKAVQTFQNRDSEIVLFIGGISAAGQGLTLTASSAVVFAELDWTPANLTQCEDRAYRIGQTDNVLVQHLVIDGSIDSLMAEKIVSKQRLIAQVIDGGCAIERADIDIDELINNFVVRS